MTASAFEPVAPELVASRVAAALEEDAAGKDATVAFLRLGDTLARAEIRVATDLVTAGPLHWLVS